MHYATLVDQKKPLFHEAVFFDLIKIANIKQTFNKNIWTISRHIW
jgi:hypothetical protein